MISLIVGYAASSVKAAVEVSVEAVSTVYSGVSFSFPDFFDSTDVSSTITMTIDMVSAHKRYVAVWLLFLLLLRCGAFSFIAQCILS